MFGRLGQHGRSGPSNRFGESIRKVGECPGEANNPCREVSCYIDRPRFPVEVFMFSDLSLHWLEQNDRVYQ